MTVQSNLRPAAPAGAIIAIGLAATFLLFGYEFIRSVSTSLFIEYYGSANLPVVMALAPVGTIAIVYVYAWLLSITGGRRALLLSSLACALVMILCYAGLAGHVGLAAGVTYVFREAYIVVIVEQYWSFINSVVPREQAAVVNGPITGFGSVGAIAGGFTVKALAGSFGTEALLLFAAASLIPAALLAHIAYGVAGEPKPSTAETTDRKGHLALRLFVRDRMLMKLLGLIVLTQVVSTVLDLCFAGLVEQAFPVKDLRTSYLGGFYGTLNVIAFILQFGITPAVLRFIPLAVTHAAIPVVHVAAAGALLLHPSLTTGAVAFTAFKALDYSLFRAAKEMLYIPLSFDARYRAKSVIDAFGYRAAKGGMSGLLAVAGRCAGGITAAAYPLIAIAAAGLWLPLALSLTWHGKAESAGDDLNR